MGKIRGAKDSVELPLRQAYPFGETNGLISEIERIRTSSTPRGVHQSFFRRGLIAELFRSQGILDNFILNCWLHGKTLHGKRLLERYNGVLLRFRN